MDAETVDWLLKKLINYRYNFDNWVIAFLCLKSV